MVETSSYVPSIILDLHHMPVGRSYGKNLNGLGLSRIGNALLAKSANFRCVGKGGKERSSFSRNLFGAHRKAQGFLRSIGFYVCLPHLIRTSKQAKVSEM